MWLKQSTAVTLKIGPFIDDTDGKTAETGLTIAQADVRLSKNGGDIAQKNEATSCTHDELGIYGCPIDTTDTATLGRLQLWVHEAGALPVWHEYMVLPANVWDSLFGADKLQVHAAEITAGLITATAIADNAIDAGAIAANAIGASEIADGAIDAGAIATGAITAAKIAADAITSSELAATAAQEIADAVWDELSTGHTDAGKAGQQLWTDVDAILADTNELQTDDIPGTLSTMDGKLDTIDNFLDTEIAAILADTGELQTDWANGGRLDLLLDTAATGSAGAGAITFTYTLTSSVDATPVADAQVWVTSDQAGSNVLASGTTDANGQAVFYLDAATVYVWRQKSGWNFTNPDTETVA